jgi:hypothetical protein
MMFTGGKWGQSDGTKVVAKEITGVPKGTYNVWVTATYYDTVNKKAIGIIGDFYERTIK